MHCRRLFNIIPSPYNRRNIYLPISITMDTIIPDWNYLNKENECRLLTPTGNIMIHEYFLKGKHSPQTNEDGIFANADFVAVADGATSCSTTGKSAGREAMEMILKEVSTFPANISLPQALQRLTDKLNRTYQTQSWQEMHGTQRPTASACIFSRARQEVWQVGDCPCLTGNRLSTNDKRTTYWPKHGLPILNRFCCKAPP